MRRTDETGRELPSRYVIGIDLGTTNSAVNYVDTQESSWSVRIFSIPQLVAPGQIEARDTLPSFHYQPAGGEMAADDLRLPWTRELSSYVVGVMARKYGTSAPGRQIASAKSWLCHAGVDRTAELLPWRGAADVERISPIEASARYLRHVKDAWDHRFPREKMADQDIVLTLPASFDEVARELTVQAAAIAGLPRVVLIEEPQAAFYAWVDQHATDWDRLVQPGQKILVCDIGGGTSDFTLIRVRRSEQSDGHAVQFHRVAVGEHLILGGDNLDLALARYLEDRLASERQELSPRQWEVLTASCRQVKEILLSGDPPERYTVHLPGTSARIIGGGFQVEITREEAQRVLVEGFFPRVALHDKPRPGQSGFQEFGLPYAPDPAVTRYLADFLQAHRHDGQETTAVGSAAVGSTAVDPAAAVEHDPARPDIVLFNGGLFASPIIRQRVIDVLSTWFSHSDTSWSPVVLRNDRLDQAVAHGAAYYGMVRRGHGVRIAAGLARSYYIGIDAQPPQAVCLVPGSAQAGEKITLDQPHFDLLISQPVEFPLYVSSTRLTDTPGMLVPVDPEQIKSLPPIRTVLKTARRRRVEAVPVQLHADLTEIGTLDLWCSELSGERKWRLQFDVRSATQTDVAAHAGSGEREGFWDEGGWESAYQHIQNTFGLRPSEKPATLMQRLARALGAERHEWPMSVLRHIWESLMEWMEGRRHSPQHEARWLNLLGYALRPGFGMAVDDWRVTETWRHIQGKLVHNSPVCRSESWILWRRIAGGLASGQQRALAEPLLASVRALHRRLAGGSVRGEFGFEIHDSAELWRLLGSLELQTVATKVELGNLLLDLQEKRKIESVRGALQWAVGRIGSRVPVYGPLNTVVPVDVVSGWTDRLLSAGEADVITALALMQLARCTGDRTRDLSPELRERVISWFPQVDAPPHFSTLVREGGSLQADEQQRVFGEALPRGLRIR